MKNKLIIIAIIFLSIFITINVIAEENEIKIDAVYPTAIPDREENDYYEVLEESWSRLKDDDSIEEIHFGNQYFSFVNNWRYNYHIKIRVKDNSKNYSLNMKSSSTRQVIIDEKQENNIITFDALYYIGKESDLLLSAARIGCFPSPKIGIKATASCIQNNDKVLIQYQKWTEEETGEVLTEDMEFKQDRTYTYEISLKTLRGYSFKDNAYVLIDQVNTGHNMLSGSSSTTFSNNNTEVVYKVKFRVRKRNQDGKIIIDSINCNVPKDIIKVGYQGYSASKDLFSRMDLRVSTNLYDESGTSVTYQEIINNKTYQIVINVHNSYPTDYVFADDFTVSFTGIEDSPYYVSKTNLEKVDDDNYQLRINYDTTVANNKIYQANICDAARPIVGKTPEVTSNYNLENIDTIVTYYNLTDNKEMTPNDKFEFDKEYKANIKLIPKAGYQFARGFFVISNNQGENVITYYKRNELVTVNESLYEENYYFSTMRDNDSLIYGPIEVEIEKPVIGQKIPHLTNIDNEKYILEDTWYSHSLELDEDAIFEEGIQYQYRVKIIPKTGYSIYDENNVLWKIPNLNIEENHTSYSTFFYDITLNEITGIYLEGNILPTIGEKASYYEPITTGELGEEANKYTVEQHWYHNDELMSDNELFEEDETYIYKAVYTAKEGYKFTNYTNISENEKYDDYYVDGNKEISLNKVEISYMFKMSKKDDIIYDYNPLQLPDLTIGKNLPTITEIDPRISIEQKWFEVDSKNRPTNEISNTTKVERNKKYILSITINFNENKTISSRIPLVQELDPANSYFVSATYGATGEEGYMQMYLYSTEKDLPGNTMVSYKTHVQSYGWQDYVSDGEMSGTSGEAKRLEAIQIKLDNQDYEGDIEYRTHIQSYGWETTWKKNDQMSGTSGEAKRLEAIQIKLTGEMADHYDVYYRVHAQKFGWLGWAKNGESAGTASFAYRLEAIQIMLVDKNESFEEYGEAQAFVDKHILYTTHVQTYGWQEYAYDGKMAGTSGEAKRLEAIKIMLNNQEYDGDVEYQTHIQTYGWETTWKKNNEISGTSGEAKRLEAIRIRLTGEMADHFDIYYRVHAQSYGWLGWAKNGEEAGTAGFAKRLEGIEIVLVEKGESPPARDNQRDTRSYIEE